MRPFGIVFVVAIVSSVARAEDSPRCVYPDPHTLLEREARNLETVEYRLFDTKAGPMRWLFLSWESPEGGVTAPIYTPAPVAADGLSAVRSTPQ